MDADNRPPHNNQTTKLLFVDKPPKPIAQMTDAEIEAYADQLYDKTAETVAQAPD
jgi:hypothetical protein